VQRSSKTRKKGRVNEVAVDKHLGSEIGIYRQGPQGKTCCCCAKVMDLHLWKWKLE
jgi:hypothetical protein